jgi:acetyltransferase-like isoleucine patch superfamily enzyme
LRSRRTDVGEFQNTAYMALSAEQQQSATRSSTNDDSEKTKMIHGQAFKRNDPTLVDDRLRCKTALQKFNSAGIVDQTVDTTNWNLLKQVITPTPTASRAPKDKTIGSLGLGTVVETPFTCEYGYNIKIGEDVYIGGNCLIIDVCPVVIGQKTSIGHNVSIISGGPGTDIVDRKGVNSTWQGGAITIGKDVIIGDGSYIYPGVKLDDRCTIEPGSVVKHNVGPGQTFGPPASGPIQLNEIGHGQSQWPHYQNGPGMPQKLARLTGSPVTRAPCYRTFWVRFSQVTGQWVFRLFSPGRQGEGGRNGCSK